MKKFFVLTFLLFVGGWVAYAQNVWVVGTITASGSIGCATAGSCVLVNVPVNAGSVTFAVVGPYSGTLQFEDSVDGTATTTGNVNCYPPNSTSAASSTTGTGSWTCAVTGMQTFDVRASAYSSGTATVKIAVSNNISVSSLTAGGGGGGTGCVPAGSAGDMLTDSGSGSCNSSADFVLSSHTLAGSASAILNLGPATGTAALVVPSKASDTATAAGSLDFDTTGKNYHVYANGADAIVAPFASAPTTGHCIQATVASGNVLLSDSGSTNCGGGGSGTVTGVLGTANQVSVTNSTTTPTVSLPTAITLPGSMLIQPASDGTEFTVKNSAGTTTVMAVNTTNGGNVLTLTPPAGGGFDLVDSSAYMGNVIVNGTLTGTASKATALASVTGYSVYGSGASAGSWLTPTANGQCLMSGASSYATTTPSFQSCPSSGTSALSGITAATGGNTIASGNNVSQIWNWAMTSASSTAFTFGETTAATSTGTNYILAAKTLAGSTASPLNVVNSLTGSQTLCTICVTPTWNTTGVVDAAIFLNVTNTASGAGSLLADLQLGGTSEWKVDKAGNETVAGSIGTGTAPTACGTATGCLAQTEGSTASTPTSGQDVMRANSTTHSFECSLNNGTETPCNPTIPTSATSGHVVSWGTWPAMADGGAVAANLVVASSPGAGVAHFAGSTQTVTSSAVTPADATGNTTGSGNFVLVTSPTLVTPTLGAASATSVSSAAYLTATKCAATGTAASPSVVSCSAAPSGSFSCATNASTATCVIDDTIVTANSAIFIQPSAAAGTLLSVTCNTTADTGLTAPRLASISASTSFTINLGTFGTNPLCFNFFIIN